MDLEETKQVMVEETKEALKWFDHIEWERVIFSAVVIVVAIAIWIVIRGGFQRWKKKKGGQLSGSAGTAASLAYSILRALLFLVVLLWVLQINGVNVTSMVAGLGIAGAIIGLAFQDFLKDIIMGAHIVTDDFFKVGDAISYDGVNGIVTAFNLRSTKIRSFDDDTVMTISNRNISEIKKIPDLILLNVPLSYDADFRKVHEVLTEAAARIARLEKAKDCQFKGTQSFDDSAITYRLNLWCSPADKWEVWRAAHKILQEVLEENDLQVPYQQIDIHNIPVKNG